MNAQSASSSGSRNNTTITHHPHNATPRRKEQVLASLRATQIAPSRPLLPAGLIATILDYLPLPALMRCARVSRKLREMVYDDTRWVRSLHAMAAWNEAEARQRVDHAMTRHPEPQRSRSRSRRRRRRRRGDEDEAKPTGLNRVVRGATPPPAAAARGATPPPAAAAGVARLEARVEEMRDSPSVESPPRTPHRDGAERCDSALALVVFARVRSIRGRARQEFARVYAALGPLYTDLARSPRHSDAVIFHTYKDPEQQAQILANLKRFAACDVAQGGARREAKLDDVIAVFENAVVREFEQGCAAQDLTGRMHRYAHVLATINSGAAAVDSFISHHPVIAGERRLGDPLDCLDGVAPGHVDVAPSQRFFEVLAGVLVEQARTIDVVFPPTVDVLTPFLSRVCEHVIAEYLTPLFDEAHTRGLETYVKAVSATWDQALRLVASLQPTKASPADFASQAKAMVVRCFEKHLDLYLAEELAVFKLKAEGEVEHWEKQLSEQQASTESFYMSNINRQAAKRDFLSSFKKVVMMPVNAFPSMSSKAASSTPINPSPATLPQIDTAYSRSQTPTTTTHTPNRSSTPATEAPTTALAAKAAIMNARLEGIRSLFSIEVALNLTHYAKASLERAARLVHVGGKLGEAAKAQCGVIFVTLLHILGDRHVRNGFDKAVRHLGDYNPRHVREFRAKAAKGESTAHVSVGVEPLVTFLELVNVGDLIQQMIDVFYAQELIATHLTDRDDFLDPAVKEKKRFEQMLDDRVAAGLNTGVDVLMDEVEYICASTQTTSDFNPPATSAAPSGIVDVGPSTTARQVVELLQSHTSMLVGSTDKNMLDVFTQEVGLRLFGVLCKHIKRHRVSVDGAVTLIADINHYSAFVASLRQKPLLPYFHALRELGQIYLVHIDAPAGVFGGNPAGKRGSLLSGLGGGGGGGGKRTTVSQAKELAAIVADAGRYCGVFAAEEVYEFAERRADWFVVRGEVERAMYGVGCVVM